MSCVAERDRVVFDDLDCKYIQQRFQGKRWREITSDELGWTSQDGWAFDQEAMLYFLPAWMIDDFVNNWDHIDKLSHYLEHYRHSILREFSLAQVDLLLEALLTSFPSREVHSPNLLIDALSERLGRIDVRPEIW